MLDSPAQAEEVNSGYAAIAQLLEPVVVTKRVVTNVVGECVGDVISKENGQSVMYKERLEALKSSDQSLRSEQMLAKYNLIVEREPNNVVALLNRAALSESMTGHDLEALDDYRHVLELDPKNTEAEEGVARLFQGQKYGS